MKVRTGSWRELEEYEQVTTCLRYGLITLWLMMAIVAIPPLIMFMVVAAPGL